MGRRSEQRIAISFPVIVRGVDLRGVRFQFITKTIDISFSGATLKGLTDVVAAGSKVEIECRTEKALFRVVWVGQSGKANADRVGVRCLEMGKYIWGVPPKEWEPDTYDPAHPARPLPIPEAPAPAYDGPQRNWTGKERRQFARHHCRIEARVTVVGDSVEMAGKITDISLGGCYVEMLSPLPDGTLIQVALSPGEGTLELSGKVCSSQTGFGMGVAFTGMGAEDFEKLRKLAPPTAEGPVAVKAASQPAPQRQAAPPREAAPRVTARSYASAGDDALDLTPTAEALEALVRLLIRKEIFTVRELAEELEKSKIVQR